MTTSVIRVFCSGRAFGDHCKAVNDVSVGTFFIWRAQVLCIIEGFGTAIKPMDKLRKQSILDLTCKAIPDPCESTMEI